jgi:SAM-dependent methyltransferase
MLAVYGYPSQAFWRAFELEALSRIEMQRPILELGCGDGNFTKQVCGMVEVGIDIYPNAVEQAARSGVFGTVRLQDARTLEDKPVFRTILANSVLEHIPDVHAVLKGCFRALRAEGNFVATVPLLDMNASMLFSSPAWIGYRQDRLSHVNLWSLEEWIKTLNGIGFRVRLTERFLSPCQLRLWDCLDGIAALGTRRINVATVLRKITKVLPDSLQQLLYSICSNLLSSRLREPGSESGCCALIVAEKPGLTKHSIGDAMRAAPASPELPNIRMSLLRSR